MVPAGGRGKLSLKSGKANKKYGRTKNNEERETIKYKITCLRFVIVSYRWCETLTPGAFLRITRCKTRDRITPPTVSMAIASEPHDQQSDWNGSRLKPFKCARWARAVRLSSTVLWLNFSLPLHHFHYLTQEWPPSWQGKRVSRFFRPSLQASKLSQQNDVPHIGG